MISASMVKDLREATGAGMLDCKKALEATNGNMEEAVTWLREKGISKAAKKQTRIAAEGLAIAKIDGNKAVGIDEITKFEYGKNPYIHAEVDIINDNEWHQYSWTFTPDSSAASSGTTRIYCGGLYSVGEVLICGYKLERGSKATPWCEQATSMLNWNTVKTIVQDSSGYNNNGTFNGTRRFASDSAKYLCCEYIGDGISDYISTPVLSLPTDAITYNLWFKSANTTPDNDYHCLFASINNTTLNQEMWIRNNGTFRSGVSLNATRKYSDITNTTGLDGNWHMYTISYDGANIKRYIDGELKTTTAATGALSSSDTIQLGKRISSNYTYGTLQSYFSDFRIYCTSLLDSEVKKLYNISMGIDKLGNSHNNEFMQDNNIQINKNGVTRGDIIEIPRLLYDNNIYVEPDGSLWVHLFHHNAPATNGYFTDVTNEQFEHSICLNEHKWFNMEVCNYVNKWEILTVRRYSSENDFVRNRWIQPINPMIATYEDVKWDNLTLYGTAEGYNTYTSNSPSNYSGYWHYTANQNSYLASSYSSTTYFGALGQRVAWNGGVASFNNNKSANAIKSGSIDVYLRIDNVKFLNYNQSSISKNIKAWLATQAIER